MKRPSIFAGPYLAMWLWVLVPLTLHGLIPLGIMPKWSINLHVGGWMEEVTGTHSMGEAFRVMRRDRTYSQCRYVRFEAERTSVILLPPTGQHCAFMRLTRPGVGHVVRSASNADLIGFVLERNR